ncbi:MAG: HEPN domain-containing protein [Nitrospirae bacterium]|jgi:HEPN domain-containing protein|nr:HEPN domain-containing protein [Nitrospirota bacterium]
MTTNSLAKSYLIKATKRLKILDVLLQEEAYSDVVRESQEIVELALKGLLRYVGIEPPKWHDVSPILKENKSLLPIFVLKELDKIIKISKKLRKERELAFYGDEDFIPTDEYDFKDAQEAIKAAIFVVKIVSRVIK